MGQRAPFADPDAAFDAWLGGLQDYLRTFNGLPAPLLGALKEQGSPLCLSCDWLVLLTGEFLARAQREGNARCSVTVNEVFLGALGIAWVLDRAEACGTTRAALEGLLARGYLAEPASEGPEVP